ncbi:hypothetical protein JJQ59_27640 [Cupriavidus necator]|uniref:Uncharacterized protein n=1 Tax=Cupriavidus necator TaxID=106590 RepID=A0A367PR07_CUPNE|nr:hypothetical protein [Cupriavidus necator]QQX86549.1 hypothetical protein JJQ59_27640 [Cupriavidus necator]RCJ10033.1 hypothetical protein DDK22_02170 [Cupriavidus necator]
MSRERIKALKKTIRTAGRAEAPAHQAPDARAAALALLRHSVRMRHERLAVIRLLDAIRLRADIDRELWRYFETVESVRANPGQLRRLRKAHLSALASPAGAEAPSIGMRA